MRRSKRRVSKDVQLRLRFVFFALPTLVLLTALLYSIYGFGPSNNLLVGQPSPRTFVAPVSVQVIDELLTEKERQVARSQVRSIFTADPQLQRLALSSISSSNLPANVQDILIAAYQSFNGVDESQKDDLIEEAVSITAVERQREVRLLLERRLISTAVPNETLTNAARSAAANAIRPIMQTLSAGQIIVEEGAPLTESHLADLATLGLYDPADDVRSQLIRTVLGSASVAILLSLPLLALIAQFSAKQLIFLIGLSIIALFVQRAAMIFDPAFLLINLVPLLVSSIVSQRVAVLWAVWLSVIVGLMTPTAPLALLVASLAGGISSSLLANILKSRPSILIAGFGGGILSAVSYLAFLSLVGGANTLDVLSSAALLIAGGSIAGILALGILPLAESSFDFLTDFRLNELSNPSSPLLQRLLLEAPGTYQHSLIISNLVEQAVKNIGGNALLARVGSLYHDVGKLKRPHFFAENQFSGYNPHDDTSPHLSYLIITSHVRDGIEYLKEYKLPKALQTFAASHHGTTVLSYFYKQALETSEQLDEFNFRYPGPKPKSKETAVLLLADAVESASRTLKDNSPNSIRALIDQLFELRLQDGQLAESPLNFHDIEVIANTFERMLSAILHNRVKYPSKDEIEKLEHGRANRRNK